MQEALDYAENIISTIREPLLVLDADLRIISANILILSAVFNYARKNAGNFDLRTEQRPVEYPQTT